VKYHLSNGQLKSLLIRHTPIRIALPAPEHDPPDWLEWARAVMDDDIHDRIVAAEPAVIAIGPHRAAEGLGSIIGEIEPRDRSLIWLCEVCIVNLQPLKKLHPPTRLQWPKSVDTASGRWPLEKDENE
jgi:hypothetical protein